ncbi:MAG: efflux RND transporter periplasmic adaptor subunit [Bacteroidales bacterium]|nr:efflux RND transporter periplasmic adaptor subunit [Bacteroidales bacterium]
MRKLVIKSVFLFTTVSLLFFGCKEKAETQQKPAPKKVALVEVKPVEKTTLVSTIEITGTIDANIFTDVVAPVDGVVETLLARENQRVEKNNIIAVINPVDRVALISNNQLQVEQLEAELKEPGKTAEEMNQLKQKLEDARKNLDYAEKMYQTVPVICPLSGLVTHRWTDLGSQVSAKEKLLTISDMNSLVIKAEANEKFFEAIKKGRRLALTMNAYPGDSLTGIIQLVYPQIDPVTRNVKFDLKILNFRKELLPGMMAQIKLPVTESVQALAVPEEAVLSAPDNSRFLFVVENDSIARRRVVSTGIAVGGKLEITQGVEENEKVVIAGQGTLKDGMKIKIMK